MKKSRDRNDYEERILKRVAIALWGIIFLVLIAAVVIFPQVANFRRAIYEATSIVTQVYLDELNYGSIMFIIAFIGKILIIYVIYVIILLFNEGMFRESIKEAIIMRRINKMSNHYIIAGGGRVGSSVAQELKKRKKQFVIIEKNPELVLEFKERKENVIEGDSFDEEILVKVGIDKAKMLITTLGNDGDNIMQIILSKKLNKKLKIIARANYPNFVENMKRFGANEVILPEIIGGKKIAETALHVK